MTTNLTIIGDALRDINVISEIGTVSPEQGKFGLRKLNQLMELWKESSLDLQYFAQTSTTDTIPIPDWAELAVTHALAILMAPGMSAPISQELFTLADITVNVVKIKLQGEALTPIDLSHLPAGTGYRRRRNILTDR